MIWYDILGNTLVFSGFVVLTIGYDGQTAEQCEELADLMLPDINRAYQEAINDTEQRLQYEGTADECLTSGREFTLELFEYLAGLSPNETHMMAVRGESFITHDTYYVVPQNCYATDLDSLSGPTLWRMN